MPLGTTLEGYYHNRRRVIVGKKLKAVTLGGPSGGVLPAQSIKIPLTYDDLGKAGAILGSGLTVIDDSVNMADLAHYFLTFFKEETCGKCTTCRKASKRCASWWVKSARDRATAKTWPAGAHGAADDRRFSLRPGQDSSGGDNVNHEAFRR